MAFDLSLDPELQPPYRCIPDLANGNVQFSLSLLSRLSAASIDPYTVALGLYVGSYFQLSSVGRRNIESSLSKLGAFSGVGEVLSFGFGPQHVVRSISATEQGATLVALCATLSECFSVDVSAEIISSIVSADVDAKSLPAMSHWHSLVRSCSGIFAGASFPLRAEKFMALHGLDSGSETTDLVDALKGVGRVSQGLEQSIAIVGSREAGFVAAFAEWLFGHTVTITDEHGTLRYSSCAPGSTPQIQVFYREPDRDVDFGPQVTCKLYILRPLSVPVESDSHSPVWGSLVLDSQVNWPRRNTKPVGGRVRWDKCLFATFGSSFEKLMKTSDVVGEIILGAAFIFEAIAKADSDVPKYLLRDSELYLESSFGKGFVHTALDRLPELAATGVNMHKARRATSFSEALNNYKHCFTLLARSCGCYNCDDPPRYHHVPPPTDDECLLVIIGTIIKVCRLLSRIEVFDSLYPSINGLQRFREDQRTRRWHLGPDYALRGYGILPEHNFRCMALEDAVCLFTNAGLPSHETRNSGANDTTCAISIEGICIYMDSLREVSNSKQLVSILHAIPGQIEYDGRPFLRVEDSPIENHLSQRSEARYASSEDLLKSLEDGKLIDHITVDIQETSSLLSVQYDVKDKHGQSTGIFVRPFQLVHAVSTFRGLVPCAQSHPSTNSSIREFQHDIRKRMDEYNTTPQAVRRRNPNTKRLPNIKLRLIRAPSLLGLCAAIMSPLKCSGTWILKDDECLHCCVDAALHMNPFSDIYIICGPDQTPQKNAMDTLAIYPIPDSSSQIDSSIHPT